MNDAIENSVPVWPLGVKLQLLGEGPPNASIDIRPGITTLVGPNGSGKTRALRAVKAALAATNRIGLYGRKIHLLSAGRSSPFETFRSAVDEPGYTQPNDAAVGHINYRDRWSELESVTGSLLVLDRRADLRLKVEARLQQLLDRSISLEWSQSGLALRIQSVRHGGIYAANHEASGILQLVALLAAIHNEETGALLVDEPEISLHPQHQSFLLEEMELVAGDPADPAKKLIVIATHSASMLPLRHITELPQIVFFTSARKAPSQVAENASILNRSKLAALVGRLSTTHRLAMFAERVLLVEGPSDETITTQLARKLELQLMARNAQVLPVTGKGEFVEVAKLFRLMSKEVAVLADLDALADDNDLVCYFGGLPGADAVASAVGRKSLTDLDGDLRNSLATFMSRYPGEVDAAAGTYPDWSSKESKALAPRRVTLARILSDPASFGGAAASEAQQLAVRYEVLLDALAGLGCFFLRRGAIENYYLCATNGGSKPERAAEEAANFESQTRSDLAYSYASIVAALTYIAPAQRVDEDKLLQLKLGAVLTPVLLAMRPDSSADELGAIARNTIGADAEVFAFLNKSDGSRKRIEVSFASPLFKRGTFPFIVSQDDNPNVTVPRVLPGLPSERR